MKLLRTILIYVSKVALVVVLLWGGSFGYKYAHTFFENQQKPAYNDSPIELKLKSKPKDVLYSQAYRTASGTDEVKYAYMTDEVSPAPNEDINRRTPNSQTEVLAVKKEAGKKIETLKTSFFSGLPQMYKDGGKWRQVEYATTTAKVFSMSGAVPYIKRRELAERPFGAGEVAFGASSTFYPDANTETTSVDGDVTKDFCQVTTSFTDSATTATVDNTYSTTFNLCRISRAFLLFDTSALPDNATVTATDLQVYVTSKSDYTTDGLDFIAVATSSPASNTALATGDFDSVGKGNLSDSTLAISSVTTSAYNTFSFNTASGTPTVSKVGVSKYSLQEGHDIVGRNVGGTPWYTNSDLPDNIGFSSADTSGTSQDPKLVVTYTTPSTFSIGQWFPF